MAAFNRWRASAGAGSTLPQAGATRSRTESLWSLALAGHAVARAGSNDDRCVSAKLESQASSVSGRIGFER